jgi:hypothetical protein
LRRGPVLRSSALKFLSVLLSLNLNFMIVTEKVCVHKFLGGIVIKYKCISYQALCHILAVMCVLRSYVGPPGCRPRLHVNAMDDNQGIGFSALLVTNGIPSYSVDWISIASNTGLVYDRIITNLA